MPALFRDKRLVLYLFVGFRLMLLLAYQPVLGSSLTTFGDFQHYYNLASFSRPPDKKCADSPQLAISCPGYQFPYRDYWYEFPPVFPIISLTTYGIVNAHGTADFTAYATLLALIMIAFDTGNLILVRRIGTRLHGDMTGQALAWIYALLAVPLIFSLWTFEPIVAFAVLLSLSWLIERRDNRSAVAAAFGALTKFFPLVMLGPVWRFRSVREAIRYTIISIGITAIGIGLMLAIAGPFGIPSLMAQFNKASYESVWALIDRNYKTGNFGPDSDHFSPAGAYILQGNPAVIPWWLRGAIFAAIGLYIYARTRRYDEKGIMAFAAITIIIFFLWSQGWSPQWLVIVLPLILLSFPNRDGVLACLLLSMVSFIEYPLLFSRTADTGGAISGAQLPIFTALVLLRTAMLIGVAVALYRRLRTEGPIPAGS